MQLQFQASLNQIASYRVKDNSQQHSETNQQKPEWKNSMISQIEWDIIGRK